jgi:hypothetical protein
VSHRVLCSTSSTSMGVLTPQKLPTPQCNAVVLITQIVSTSSRAPPNIAELSPVVLHVKC